MFSEYDCFELTGEIPGRGVPIGTVDVVLVVLDGGTGKYEVEFADGQGGNLGNDLTYTIDESVMKPVDTSTNRSE